MAVFISTTPRNGLNPAHWHTDCANFEDGYELDQCMAMKWGVDQVVIKAIVLVILFQVSYGLPLIESGHEEGSLLPNEDIVEKKEAPPWFNYLQTPVWGQFGQNSERVPVNIDHGPDGGSVDGQPSLATSLGTINNPVVDWSYGTYTLGNDALSTPVASLHNQIVVESGAEDRCGADSLFSFIVQTGSNDRSYLRIIDGDDSDLAWELDLGETELIKTSPVLTDVNNDGKIEVIVGYDDASGSLNLRAYSPILNCGLTGWSPGGTHLDELLWSWSDPDLAISRPSPSPSISISGHRPTTQLLLADTDHDGVDEILMSVWNQANEEINVLAMDLGTTPPTSPIWAASLDQGSHPSDPAYVKTDPSTGYVLITTTDSSTGAVWLWKLDGANGNEAWSPRSMGNTDGDSNVPHVRMPGPVVANLDSDAALEVVVTIPTDLGGTGNADGAEYRALEVTDGQTELWSVNAIDGYADAPPLPVDSDGDGVSDYLCWVTWTMTSEGLTQERSGFTGCHNVNQTIPTMEWSRTLDLVNSDGVLNDEVAVAPPAILNVDGQGAPELLVGYGRGLHAFDGDTGSPAGADSNWTQPIEMPHRTWSEIVLADLNGDASYDALLGTASVSNGIVDVRPLQDGRAMIFDPSEPDPGEDVLITAFLENSGNIATDGEFDAVLYADGTEINRFRSPSLDPVAPSGTGSDVSFQTSWSGGLGNHEFRLVLDPMKNLTQAREDNDAYETTLSILPPFNATISIPSTPTRVDPGGYSEVSPNIISTGRESGTWTLSIDGSGLPQGWSWEDETPGGLQSITIGVGQSWSPVIKISAPATATGDEEGRLTLTLALESDPNVTVVGVLPVEANRTRGLSILGPEGLPESEGSGFSGSMAMAWIMVENLGNAVESQVLRTWSSTEWGDDLKLYDSVTGDEIIGMSLEPFSKIELFASLEVPLGSQYGENVSTTLELCVGQGEDLTCDDITLKFISASITIDPPHRRMVPGHANYTIRATIPQGTDSMNWSISDLGMSLPGWSWSSSDSNLSIIGDKIQITGLSGTVTEAVLELEHDIALQYVQPGFFLFRGLSDDSSEGLISFSIEILQQHDASLEMANPGDSNAMSNEVGVPFNSVLKMRNPGNGPDQYSLSWGAVFQDDGGAVDIDVILALESASLSPGELQTVPVSITLREGTEAQRPILITITMVSILNGDTVDSVAYTISAIQDRSWSIQEITSDGQDVMNKSKLADPGSMIHLRILAGNQGNYPDNASLSVVTTLDGSIVDGLISPPEQTGTVSTGGIAFINTTLSIPSNLNNGSIIHLTFNLIAGDGALMASASLDYEITRRSAWGATFGGADLEIPLSGSLLAIDLIQLGNAASTPYISTQIVGQKGWIVEPPVDLGEMTPGEIRRVLLNVTPPENAVHSLTVDLILRIRDFDGAGLTEISIPTRVEASRSFELDGNDVWHVTNDGGFPLAWIQNTGNAATSINLSIIGLPDAWQTEGPPSMAIGTGESQGIPISLVPPSDWDGGPFIVRIAAINEVGVQSELMVSVSKSNFSWSSPPVSMITKGGSGVLRIHGTGPTSEVMDIATNRQLEWDPLGFWTLPESDNMVEMGSVIVDGTDTLPYMVRVIDSTSRVPVCSLFGTYGSMGSVCLIGEGEDSPDIYGMLVDEKGRLVDSNNISLQSGLSGYLNMSYDSWAPTPGAKTISVRIYDEFGRLLLVKSQDIQIRHSDYWNLGIVGLELDPPSYDPDSESQGIRVLISRDGLQSYDDLECKVLLQAPGIQERAHSIDVAGTFAPEPLIARPESLDDGVEVTVSLACEFPWDQDSEGSDNLQRIILAGEANSDSRSEDFRTGAISGVIVIIIGGMFILNSRSRGQQKDLEEMARKIIRDREVRRQKAVEKSRPPPKVAAVVEEQPPVQKEQLPPAPQPQVKQEADKYDDDLDDFERRLRRLGNS